MEEKQKSFEEFFYTKTNSICSIEKLSDYVDTHEGDYTPYKGFMLCPECKRAELTFVHKSSIRRAHLRKRSKLTHHMPNCSYNYEYASKKLIKEYVDSLTYSQVQDRLNAIMNMLCGNNIKEEVSPTVGSTKTNPKDNPVLIPDAIKDPTNLKALRRKRLAGWIDKSDGIELHIFYGKVKLSVEKKSGKKDGAEYIYYLLTLYTKNRKGEWKYCTSIYRGKTNDTVHAEKIYQIAMIGNLNFNYNWWQIDLINRNAIRYREIF